ncbi:MAG: MBOAT family protein [Clostridia bacterium]|nr:MBOAT family protein [Clostridia bacterium]
MVFSSLVFLFGFLPITLILYWIAPKRWKNAVLFGVSLFFYAWGEPIYILLMLLSITSAYLFGFLIDRYRAQNSKLAKAYTVISVSVNLAALFFFKYYNFLAGAVHAPILSGLVLPIGISFYTFQILSYTVDLYRGEIALQRNYLAFGTYVTLFPQLVAGPIVKYSEIDQALTERTVTTSDFFDGVIRFVFGLCKKLLIGDALASGYEYYKGLMAFTPTTLGAWMVAVFYSLHLYFDFSGYSDMAIGLGRMFGFRFPENFKYPYISKSISEFWRRWHITLSSWFRDYVYIPLGGNRCGRAQQCRNLLIVWMLTGIWHGAGWNFVLWGLYFGILLILEKLFLLRVLEKTPSILRHLYTLILVFVSFLIFSSSDLSFAWRCFSAMIGRGTVGFSTDPVAYQLLRYLSLLAVAGVGATPIVSSAMRRFLQKGKRRWAAVPVASAVLLLICTAYLVDSTYSPFAYFNF